MAEKSFVGDKKDKKWFSNLWYYYGKWMIAGLIVIIFIVSGCVSCYNQIDYDLEIAYFANKPADSAVYDNMTAEATKVVDDADGRHGVNVFFHDYIYDMHSDARTEYDMAIVTKIQLELSAGSSYAYIMTEDWYNYIVKYETLDDVSEYIGGESAYFAEITDNALIKSLGFNEERLYIGVRGLFDKEKDDEIAKIKHNNAVKLIQYICEQNN